MQTESLQALLLVLEHGSLAGAAVASGVPRSTLRRRVEQLEVRLGAPLFVRDATGSTPTPAAIALADRARPLIAHLEGLADEVREEIGAASGTLRLRLPPGLPPELLPEGLAQLFAAFPGVRVAVEIGRLDGHDLPPHVDVAVLLGEPAPEGPYRTRVMARLPERLVASEAWIARHGAPTTVEDLQGVRLLSWRPCVDGRVELPLVAGGGVTVTPSVCTPDVHALRAAALAGAGVAWVPDPPLLPGVGMQGLVRVLDGVVGGAAELRLVVPERVARSPRTRGGLDVILALQAFLDADG